MNTFEKDSNNQEILLSKDEQQVMMEWERPYMEASIDMVKSHRTRFRNWIWLRIFSNTNNDIQT
jgi:hypothetical protein